MCDVLTATPIACPLCNSGWRGEEVEKLGVKLSLGRSEEWGESVLRFSFISHYPTLI